MEVQEKNYVHVLCYIDENWMDIGGNIFPEDGVVSAKEFTDDINIQFGLYGILWGITDCLIYENIDGDWVVVKVEIDNDFMFVDEFYNRVKFNNGMVVCSGSVEEAGEFLWINRDEMSSCCYYFPEDTKKENIVGTKKWLKKFRDKLCCS